MRNFLVGLSALSFVVVGLVACSGGAGDLPTQRGASLSSSGSDGVANGGGNGGNGGSSAGGGGSKGGGETVDPAPATCELGAECEGAGTTCVVTSCDNNEPTCSCVGGGPTDAG